jgi:quercetin dioxygenase-like cupin family protein
MNLKPGQEIGKESHNGDQFIYIMDGFGAATLWLPIPPTKTEGEKISVNTYDIFPGVGVSIPAGVKHNILNNSTGEMKILTIYSPPEHREKTYQPSKEESEI